MDRSHHRCATVVLLIPLTAPHAMPGIRMQMYLWCACLFVRVDPARRWYSAEKVFCREGVLLLCTEGVLLFCTVQRIYVRCIA